MATLIYDVNDLQDMNLDLAADYELANDIDASATVGWNAGAGFLPIGRTAPYFTGRFDGRGHTISNLFINRPATDYIGLFGYTDGATIQDVILTTVNITGDDCIGTLIGYAENTTIKNCSSTGSLAGDDDSGGLIGYVVTGSINTCHSAVVVTSVSGYWVGGLVGETYDVDIDNSYATGNVTVGLNRFLGGFIGYIWSPNITKCYSTGNVVAGNIGLHSNGYGVGGFVGHIREVGDITECYASGSVTVLAAVGHDTLENGGFVGQLNDAAISNCYARGAVTSDNAGGFAGTNDGSIDKCYATGLVTGGDYCGGLIASSATPPYWNLATNSFWDTQTTGQVTSDSGTGKTTAQMQTKTTFSAWDFSSIWSITTYCNNGYPCLLNTTPNCALIPSIQGPQVREIIALEAMRNIEMSCMGRVYVDEEGNLTYESRYARNP